MTRTLHPDDDRWLDLVNDLLPPDVHRETIAHARSCPACGERLRAFAAAHERMLARAPRALLGLAADSGSEHAQREDTRSSGAKGGNARDTSADDDRWLDEPDTPRRVWRGSARRRAWAPALAAAAVAVVVGALWMGTAREPGRLVPVAPAPMPAPDASILTRDPGDSPSERSIARGLEAYRRQDYAAAVGSLASTRASGPLEQVRRLYLGSAQLQRGDAHAAIRTLRGVDRALVPEPWLGELDWTLAVALATTSANAPAESLRRVLAERDDEIGERARRGWVTPPGPP